MRIIYFIIACVMALSMTRSFAVEPPVRIMPLGDSLTFGEANTSVQGGYRTRLYNLLTAANFNVDFVGTFSDDPNQGAPDGDHQGWPGARTDALLAALPGWLDEVEDPDVVLLLIGTNDIWQNVPVSQALTNLSNLIADMATRLPFAKIIVSNLPQRTDSTSYEALQVSYNAGIPGVIAQHVALGRQVSFVNMHNVITPFLLSSDGVHLSTAGYNKMADTWTPAITSVISPKGTANPPLIASAAPLEDLTQLQVVFSKPVADNAANLGNFSLSGGLTISNVVLDATTKRTVTLTTSPQTRGVIYTVSVSGVKDRTARQTGIAPQSMAYFSQNPLTNRSFENGYTGWTASGNQHIKSGSPYYATDGSSLVAFNGNGTTPNGILSQTFATTAGRTYELEFDYGVWSTNNRSQSLKVTVQGATTLISNTLTIQRAGTDAVTWAFKYFQFTANSSTTTITFTDLSTTTNNIDLLLDSVWLAALEKPSLAVTATPPGGAGVTISPNDTSGLGNGSTGLIRSYDTGASVTVTAPAAVAGRSFIKWRKHGVDLSGAGRSLTLTMNTNQSLEAVYDANLPPVALPQSITLDEDATVGIALTATDPDDDNLNFTVVAGPAHGTLSGIIPDLTYDPLPGYSGTDSFTFKANDGLLDSVSATVSITIQPLEHLTDWLDDFGLTDGPGEDSDEDSISNVVEYVVGGNPAAGSDVGLLPTATLVTADPDNNSIDDNYLLFTYRRTLGAHTDPSVALRVEWNTAFDGSWNNATGAPGVVTTIDTSLGPDTDLVKVHIPYSLSTSGVLFARLRVVVGAP